MKDICKRIGQRLKTIWTKGAKVANGVYSTTAEGSTSSDQTMMEFRGVPAFKQISTGLQVIQTV